LRKLLALAVLLVAPRAAADAHSFGEIETQLKTLAKPKDPALAYESFTAWLGLSSKCPAGCKTFSSKWIAAELDGDPEAEKVLAITASAGGKCGAASLEVFVFDAVGKDWSAVAHESLALAGADAPVADVAAKKVHDPKIDDLILHVDGRCEGGAREQQIDVLTLEKGKLRSLAASQDYVGSALLSYEIVGAAPATIELHSASGKSKLLYDEASVSYDALPPYESTLKASLSKDDDDVLSTSECAAPLPASLASECKLDGTMKVQVVVQHGKAIGLTVKVDPSKPKTARCVRKKVAAASWKDLAGASGCVRTFAAK
jgi:hypothetical protein